MTDQGLCKCSWRLDVDELVWLPRQNEDTMTQAHHPYVVVGAIAHQGDRNSGHLRAVGRGAAGWVIFDDMREAQLAGAVPPMTEHWVCIFLIREDAVDLSLWSHHVVGLEDKCCHLASLHHLHGTQFSLYPAQMRHWLTTHCCLCGKLIISHAALVRHVRNRHSSFRAQLQEDWDVQSRRWISSLPCDACGARPVLGFEPLQLDHMCQLELNVRLGMHYYQADLLPRRTGSADALILAAAAPVDATPEDLVPPDRDGLGEWLRDHN